jgi:hypothetical protein
MNYLTNDNGTTRQMTETEIAQYEIMLAEIAKEQLHAEQKTQSKASARTKLIALGLTDDEIMALIP